MKKLESLLKFVTENQTLVISAAVVILLIIIFLCSYFSKGRRKGRAAERKVAAELKKLGRKDHIRIMNNIYLPMYKGCCEIDHLVLGRFGVLVIETKGISGEISGSGDYLTHNIGSKTHSLYNPQVQNKTHMDNVVHHLKKGRFFDIPVRGAVVFTAKDVTYPRGIGMDLDGLKKFYHSLHNAGCDEGILYDYFNSIRVRDPIKKLKRGKASSKGGKKSD